MKIQIIKDDAGKDTGVFIPMNDWEIFKAEYPEIQAQTVPIDDWQKQLVLKRLAEIKANPDMTMPISNFFSENNNMLNEPEL